MKKVIILSLLISSSFLMACQKAPEQPTPEPKDTQNVNNEVSTGDVMFTGTEVYTGNIIMTGTEISTGDMEEGTILEDGETEETGLVEDSESGSSSVNTQVETSTSTATDPDTTSVVSSGETTVSEEDANKTSDEIDKELEDLLNQLIDG